jgi:hypothetical protein
MLVGDGVGVVVAMRVGKTCGLFCPQAEITSRLRANTKYRVIERIYEPPVIGSYMHCTCGSIKRKL